MHKHERDMAIFGVWGPVFKYISMCFNMPPTVMDMEKYIAHDSTVKERTFYNKKNFLELLV